MPILFFYFGLIILSPTFAFSEEQVAKAPVIPGSGSQLVSYQLAEMQPISVSIYPTPSKNILRHYLQFRNQEGNHFLVYEEDVNRTPAKEFIYLEHAMENWNSSCVLDLECFAKPFCTGKCKNMYYQVSSLPTKAPADGQAQCHLASFTCARHGEVSASPLIENAGSSPKQKSQ